MTDPTDTPGTSVPTPVDQIDPLHPPVEFPEVEGAIADLQLQEATVRQLLNVLEDAGHAVLEGAPSGLDADSFGGTRRGERMARHTAGAQDRVLQTLYVVMQALSQHHTSLDAFRGEVLRVEADAVDQMDAVRRLIEETTV